MGDLPALDDLGEPDDAAARDALDRLAVIKLNGGLGTSMGLAGPKSLLEIKPGTSFLDAVARQTLALRERHAARLPLLVMNSEGTREPSLAALRRHEGLEDPELPLDFLQGSEPKLRADDWHPVVVARRPAPGVVPAGARRPLHRAGRVRDPRGAARGRRALVLRVELRQPRRDPRRPDRGVDGRAGRAVRARGRPAHPDGPQGRAPGPPRRRPGAARDRPGARRRRLVHRHRAVLLLQHQQPVVRPRAPAHAPAGRPGGAVPATDRQQKTVDPTDKAVDGRCCSSRPRWARRSGRSRAPGRSRCRARRFAPVKTTDDLLVARSDLYDLTDDGRMVPDARRRCPVVGLEKAGVRDARRLRAPVRRRGAVAGARVVADRRRATSPSAPGVAVEGDVTVEGPRHVDDGETLRG